MSYVNLLYHVVVRTKYSKPTIDEVNERQLYMYVYSFVRSHNSKLYRIGGMPDHVHMLLGLHPTLSLANFMRDLKVSTSKFMKLHSEIFPLFEGWEAEYYASTVSQSQLENVRQYIINQKSHHKKLDFRNEILDLCREEGIQVDERYL